jgi:hypothetical protein
MNEILKKDDRSGSIFYYKRSDGDFSVQVYGEGSLRDPFDLQQGRYMGRCLRAIHDIAEKRNGLIYGRGNGVVFSFDFRDGDGSLQIVSADNEQNEVVVREVYDRVAQMDIADVFDNRKLLI